jgi:hypothetical protein
MALAFLLVAALAAPASARAWPDCLHVGAKKAPPRTFAELRSCQKRAARRLDELAESKGKPLSDADHDALAEHQRSEARKFMARAGVVVEGPTTPEPAPDGAAGAANGENVSPLQLQTAAAYIKERFQSAGIKRFPQKSAERLKAAVTASGGRITPEIQRMIDEEIKAAPADAYEAPEGDDGPH